MIKKILVSSCLAIMTFTVNAAPYIGADVGAAFGKWDMRDSTGVSTNFNKIAPIGRVSVGVGADMGQFFYLGMEGFGDYTSEGGNSKTFDAGATSGYIKRTYGYGVSLLPGVKMYPGSTVFGRAGYVRSHFIVNNQTTQVKITNNIYGTEFGAGVQTALSGNADLRVEYDYIRYRALAAFGYRIKPRDNQVTVGLVLRFE